MCHDSGVLAGVSEALYPWHGVGHPSAGRVSLGIFVFWDALVYATRFAQALCVRLSCLFSVSVENGRISACPFGLFVFWDALVYATLTQALRVRLMCLILGVCRK